MFLEFSICPIFANPIVIPFSSFTTYYCLVTASQTDMLRSQSQYVVLTTPLYMDLKLVVHSFKTRQGLDRNTALLYLSGLAAIWSLAHHVLISQAAAVVTRRLTCSAHTCTQVTIEPREATHLSSWWSEQGV